MSHGMEVSAIEHFRLRDAGKQKKGFSLQTVFRMDAN
jgi:hypothetical protein